MLDHTESKQADGHSWKLWGVIAKVRPKPSHPCYYAWQHGFLVVVLYGKTPEAASTIAKAIIKRLPYEFAAATVAVREAAQLGDLCANAVTGGRQLGLGISLLAFATGSDEEEFEAAGFYS